MALNDMRTPAPPTNSAHEFSAAEIGALAHLYRGEVYRSTVWRTRLDSTTNWAVVTTGIALSATYSSAEASPLPMVLVGLLVCVFLLFEARRYRYFNVWRARARLLETDFYAPMIRGEGVRLNWAGQSCSRRTMASRTTTSASPARSVGGLDHTYCVSAWNKDPVFGVIGIQSGPRGLRVHSGFHDHGSRGWDVDRGDDC